MLFQAVKGMAIAHTALCPPPPPLTVSTMSLSWQPVGITVTYTRSNGNRMPATIISPSECWQHANIEYAEDAEDHCVSHPTVPAHRIQVCICSPSPSPDGDLEEYQDPDVEEDPVDRTAFKNKRQASRSLQAFSPSSHKPVESNNRQPRALQGIPFLGVPRIDHFPIACPNTLCSARGAGTTSVFSGICCDFLDALSRWFWGKCVSDSVPPLKGRGWSVVLQFECVCVCVWVLGWSRSSVSIQGSGAVAPHSAPLVRRKFILLRDRHLWDMMNAWNAAETLARRHLAFATSGPAGPAVPMLQVGLCACAKKGPRYRNKCA